MTMRGYLDNTLRRSAGKLDQIALAPMVGQDINLSHHRKPIALNLLLLVGLLLQALSTAQAKVCQEPNAQILTVQAGFTDKQPVAPDEAIELTLNRPLTQGEGRLAVVIGSSDLTDLFAISARSLKYGVKTFPLPVGETALTVYLVTQNDEWRELARFPLRVAIPQRVANAAPASAPEK